MVRSVLAPPPLPCPAVRPCVRVLLNSGGPRPQQSISSLVNGTLQLLNTPSTATASESSGLGAADVTLSAAVLDAIDENLRRRR